MSTLWLLTEECPKKEVILEILRYYAKDKKKLLQIGSTVEIVPVMKTKQFLFEYHVNGVIIDGVSKIIISTISGRSSFVDFLIFEQPEKPDSSKNPIPLYAIEETKTSDKESRNTAVYQRCSKFVFIDLFYKNIKKIMLYNDQVGDLDDYKPPNTSIFGTNMLLSINVEILGKETTKYFKKFKDIEDLINFKRKMRSPPASDVPITINKTQNGITISGRLANPKDKGNIGHDPSIGALSLIAKTLRTLGWNKNITITNHAVFQSYVTKNPDSKFLHICNLLDIKLEGLSLKKPKLKKEYWKYEKKSEKIGTIFLHLWAEHQNMKAIYSNHAGCERGYFFIDSTRAIQLPKKDGHGEPLSIPDLILQDNKRKKIYLIEGKQTKNLEDGLRDLANYDCLENEHINTSYSGFSVERWLVLFGGKETKIPHEKVLMLMTEDGNIVFNNTAPSELTLF